MMKLANTKRGVLIPLLYEKSYWPELKHGLLPHYYWDFELGTTVLNHDKSFQDFYIEEMKRIQWDLGFECNDDKPYKDFLKDQGWLIEE